ncbi:MAG: DNA repair protein RecN [Limibacillus sp.]|jgi:DNA repair protein RecN (Recombination protein N)
MLVSLAIRDVVLIDRLDLNFEAGLAVLTGETGAGKSILLDSLGLALGERADSGLLRKGAERASVVAAFDLPEGHPAHATLEEGEIELEPGEPLLLRRQLGADGRSRAFANDQPISVALLRALGESLVEVQGHFEQRGLMDPKTHRQTLDAFAGLASEVSAVGALHAAWKAAERDRAEAAARLEKARGDEAFLRHALGELEALDPKEGEEEELAERRSLLMHATQVLEAMEEALTQLDGAEGGMAAAQRRLERAADKAGGRLDAIIAGLERSVAELEEARIGLQSLAGDEEFEAGGLERIEERFFALKDLARKHHVEVASLPALRQEMTAQLGAIEGGGDTLKALEAKAAEARKSYLAAARALHEKRSQAALKLDEAVNAELPPLKLEKANFRTLVEELDEADAGPLGLDRVAFEVSTNPGSAPGPLGRIASAGELSRFLLAIKLVLAGASPVGTLVFDEVDSGVGGATAAAVGERLARLAGSRQVLVVTHSPQVAARGDCHWHVQKESDDASTLTRVLPLDSGQRREEIARMLSGAEITEAARAAADQLMGAAE